MPTITPPTISGTVARIYLPRNANLPIGDENMFMVYGIVVALCLEVFYLSTTNTALSIEGLTHQFLFLDFKTNGEQGWSDIRMIIKLLILALVLNVGFIVTDCNGGIVYPKAPDGGE